MRPTDVDRPAEHLAVMDIETIAQMRIVAQRLFPALVRQRAAAPGHAEPRARSTERASAAIRPRRAAPSARLPLVALTPQPRTPCPPAASPAASSRCLPRLARSDRLDPRLARRRRHPEDRRQQRSNPPEGDAPALDEVAPLQVPGLQIRREMQIGTAPVRAAIACARRARGSLTFTTSWLRKILSGAITRSPAARSHHRPDRRDPAASQQAREARDQDARARGPP